MIGAPEINNYAAGGSNAALDFSTASCSTANFGTCGGPLGVKSEEVWRAYAGPSAPGGLNATYFQWNGKPLLVVYMGTPALSKYGTAPPVWTDPRFTVRFMTGWPTEQPSMMSSGGAPGVANITKFSYMSWCVGWQRVWRGGW